VRNAHGSLVIEGTGHAGVGSCFGLSNARVAELMGAKVVIVASGGIGKPIDEVNLNLSLFSRQKVEVIGVILNKVLERKYVEVQGAVAKGLRIIGTRLLGALPYVRTLTQYTVGQVSEEFGYEVLCGKRRLSNIIENTVVLAMRPEHSARHIRKNSLVLIPADRPENVRTALGILKNFALSNGGVVLTGSGDLDSSTRQILQESDIPTLVSPDDTFAVSSRMVHLEFKIRISDEAKIRELKRLVARYVDVDYIVKQLFF
jgi:BioD-like phosphotransacetylase family protein